MPIRLKIASTAKEVDDALWVRHQVFVIEDGRFGGKPLPGERLVDRFDAISETYNIVAYEGAEPVAAMRLFRESELGLPVEDSFDFSGYRERARMEKARRAARLGEVETFKPPEFGGAGMLAIRGPWRRRRDVIRAMFRLAATVCRDEGVSHVLLTVNHRTASMYRRLGFEILAEKVWSDEIGDHIAALAASAEDFLLWAFGGTVNAPLDLFRDSFERWVLRAGEAIFEEGSRGEHAFVIESGSVRVTRKDAVGKRLTLAHLSRGDLFGELALVDQGPRSATTVAISDTELIVFDQTTFQTELELHPEKYRDLFAIFASRIRSMDKLALMLAYSPKSQRLQFGLDEARQRAAADCTDPDRVIFKGGPAELSILAALDEQFVRSELDKLVEDGKIEFSDRHIRFIGGD